MFLDMNIALKHTFESVDFAAILQSKEQLINKKDKRIVSLESELSSLKEHLAWLKKQIFGQKSEKFVDLLNQPLLPEISLEDTIPNKPEKETIKYERNKRYAANLPELLNISLLLNMYDQNMHPKLAQKQVFVQHSFQTPSFLALQQMKVYLHIF